MIAQQDRSLLRFAAILRRRRYSAGVAALLVAAGGSIVVWRLPSSYRAQAVVRMDEGQPPKEYVPPTVTEVVADRLKAIRLELLERPLLAEVAREQGVPLGDGNSIDEFRSRFDVKVEGVDTFVLSYEDSLPARAAAIVNDVCRRFTGDHDRRLQDQATQAKDLFDTEVTRLRRKYEDLQANVEGFDRAHYGALPGQLEGNLRTLDELQADIDAQQNSLDMAQDRKRALETQELDYLRHQEDTLADQYHLAETEYTEDQPEVANARREYESVKAQRHGAEAAILRGAAASPAVHEAQGQIDAARAVIHRLRAHQADLRAAVAATEANAETLAKLTVALDATRQQYQDMLAKDEDARLAALEEKRITGPDRFEVLEAAVKPSVPAGPNRPLLLGLVIGAALCLGIGLALLREALDTTLHDPEDVATLHPDLRLLAAIPRAPASRVTVPRTKRS